MTLNIMGNGSKTKMTHNWHFCLRACFHKLYVVLVRLSKQMLCSFYQRYRDVTARIKASSCPSIPPAPAPAPAQPKDTNTDTNEEVQKRCFTIRGLWSQFAFKARFFLQVTSTRVQVTCECERHLVGKNSVVLGTWYLYIISLKKREHSPH